MIKHVVCFKLKEGEDVDFAANLLLSMKGNVSEIIDIEVGKDFLHSQRSYDIILIVTLKDKYALESYQKNQYHSEVVKTHMHKVRESSVAVDYEF
ncbi:MAG: Dabb family protein [Clostridia bacterium]|nr:Dabb family protein [Clostridia bacterium]